MTKVADINVRLGLDYVEQGKMRQAKGKLLLAIKQAPKDPAPWYAMGYFNEKVGLIDQANKDYKKAVKLAPKDGRAQNNYGTFLCRIKQYDAAIKQFITAAREPGYLDAGGTYENAGLCALAKEDNREALQFFHTALKSDPNLPTATFFLAKISFERGDFQTAENYLRRFDDISEPTLQSLKLAIDVAKKTGNKGDALNNIATLKQRFPQSQEAQDLSLS